MKTKKVNPTKVVTDEVRFSYLQVFEPKAIEDGAKPKYSVSLIIPKKNKKLIAKIEAAIDAAAEVGKTSKFGGKIPRNLKSPLRDGDEDRPEDEAYVDSLFMNANAITKPGVVDENLDPIIDKSDFYSGCYGRASVNFYAYNTSGNKGIACGLNGLQKTADGDSLGGAFFDAEEDFGDSIF